MPLRLGDERDFVQLEVLERGSPDTQSAGDLRLSVSVRSDGFCGAYDQVHVARDDWADFLLNLARLERDRAGRATLSAMSPDEFELHLQITDRAGHLAAHGFLARYHFGHVNGNCARSRVEYSVPVDPSLLRQLVRDFESLPDASAES